ncbi:hypothetical protein [Paraburkholderia tagetis]|uniref:Phage tail sheath protein n=1 Tax=Paraburkholderia tagetis TaxID=2913261 RepID=A0A9X1UG35_9BURK|nr:hypothetical protein [Paraburkholderia tagetis]MCG5072067.1 hypothetical protein [Paraburkholderia tagetis]
MSATVPAAFPFILVNIDTSALMPIAQRSPGVIAIVGKTPAGADGGDAAFDMPTVVDTASDVSQHFAKINADGSVADTTLSTSLKLAMLQSPTPSKIYGVKVNGTDYAGALASLEAADDVDFVCLANETDVGAAAGGGNPPTNLLALKAHVETMSAQGQKRLGVAMVNPATVKSPTYVHDVDTTATPLKSDSSRMVLVAARGATVDVAAAATGAIAGYAPQVSMVLKRVRGVSVPTASQYGPSEIKGLSEAGIVPIIEPALIVGGGFYFGEGRCYTTDASQLYIDIVRVLDDIDFRLKAGLIGLIGDSRITKAGLTQVKVRIDSILGPLLNAAVIDDYATTIPVLNILMTPESAWSATDSALVVTARANRTVDVFVSITYGPAVHQLRVTLAPSF